MTALRRFAGRAAGACLLVVSIAPIPLLAPSLADAPTVLWRQLTTATVAHAAVSGCPAALRLERSGPTRAIVRWQGRSRLGFEVRRDGAVVGRTSLRRMGLATRPERRVAIEVRSLQTGCRATLRVRVPYLLPGPPRSLAIANASDSGAILSWRAGTAGDAGIAGYRLVRDGRVLRQVRGTAATIATGRTSTIQVAAVDRRGRTSRLSPALSVLPGHEPPAAPQAIRTSGRGGSLHLSWRRSRIGDAPMAGYRVTRDGQVLGQTARTRFTTSRPSSRAQAFEVRALDRAGYLSPPSRTVRVGRHHLEAPAELVVARLGLDRVLLRWSAVPRASAYRVRRDGRTLGQHRSRRLAVRLSSLRSYLFEVVAVDRGGRTSPPSPGVRVRTGHRPPNPPRALSADAVHDRQAVVSWLPATPGIARVARYRIYRDGRLTGTVPAESRSAALALTPGRAHRVSATAVDTLGYESDRAAPIVVSSTRRPPSPPESLRASDLTDRQVTLSWSPGSPGSGPIAGYRVYRNGNPVRQVSGTSLRDSRLSAGRTYVYAVAAVDSNGLRSATSPPISLTAGAPPQSTGHMYAFQLASTDSSFRAFQRHYRRIGTVLPTYFDCVIGSGEMIGRDDPLVSNFARLRGVEIHARVNCQHGNTLSRILNDPQVRSVTLDRIESWIATHDYDGVNLDFEAGYAADRAALTSFVAELAERLHARGKELSICVSAKVKDIPNHPRSTFFDYEQLLRHVDQMIVMAWGIYWSTSPPGPQDDLPWVRDVIAYASTLDQRGKIVLGDLAYAMDWRNGGGPADPADAYSHAEAVDRARRLGATRHFDALRSAWTFSYWDPDGTRHDVWHPDAGTMATRFQTARNAGLGGAAMWRLGQEDERLWTQPIVVDPW